VYTRCPACKKAYRIGVEQLRAKGGEVECEHCHAVFNALASLAKTVKDASDQKQPVQPESTPVLGDRESVAVPGFQRERLEELDSAWKPEAGEEALMPQTDLRSLARSLKDSKRLRWAGAALALLGIQVFGFEGQRLAQNLQARPVLESLCAVVRCSLPPFKDAEHLAILDRSLNAGRDNKERLDFRLVFANRSKLPQAFPNIRLVLDALDGQPVAERVFVPLEYFAEWQDEDSMPVGQSYEIRLSLAKPSREVGGFSIEFQ
jgi:predicted Zn finger-like uncharacterized protein